MKDAAPKRPPRLVVVSNRLPLSLQASSSRGWQVVPGSGGLVTALEPVLRERGGMWIGWSGQSGATRGADAVFKAASSKVGYDLVSVPLNADDVRDFYHGFSNEAIWPLFHDLPSLCNFDPKYWSAYCKVNARYARAIARHASGEDRIWVHDYHLVLVGGELRRLGLAANQGFFLHIPFPSPDIFRCLPWRREILEALMQYDLIGFQTRHDLSNFLACVGALIPGAKVRRGKDATVVHSGRSVRAGSYPISIDYADFMRSASAPEVESKVRELHALLPHRKLVLGIDRLDYTKGIALRLKAFHDLLERFPSLRGQVSLMQVVVPSREDIPHYQRMKTEIEQTVGRINGAFARPGGWVPVWYEYRSLSRLELLAYYRAADIALITPLKDGMNLVAKEYCACSMEEDCVLILSEAAGAAEQLGRHAMLVNPHDYQGVAAAIKAAHEMPYRERIRRMRAMRRSIRSHDVFRWVDEFLSAMPAHATAELQSQRLSRRGFDIVQN